MDSLWTVVMVTVGPDEYTISCVKIEFLIKVVEVAGGFATFGVMFFRIAALKAPNPIFISIVVLAVHSRHHEIFWASVIEGMVKAIQKSRPETGLEGVVMVGHFTTGKPVLAIFGTVAVPALY